MQGGQPILSDKEIPELLKALVNSDSVGITIINAEGTIIFRNEFQERFSGTKNREVIGKHFSVLPAQKEISQVLETGIPILGILYEASSGKKAIVHRLPLRDSKGRVIGTTTMTVFGDVEDMVEILAKYNLMESKITYYEQEIRKLREAKYSFKNIVGKSDRLRFVIKLARKYAKSNSSVLITGTTGTGKELFAHAIHSASPRNFGPFVVINCPSIPDELLESELFGYEPGAFSGAMKKGKAGKFEIANKGTIFLDEISSLKLDIQPKLLRVLQDKRIERLGGNKSIDLDFRIIAASNRNIQDLIKEGVFREDLFYRLSVLSIDLPLLKEREGDIPLLVDHFLTSLRNEGGLMVRGISKQALDFLCNYSWPGNIRELQNVLEKAATSSETGRIELKDLPAHLIAKSPPISNRGFSRSKNINILKESKQNVESALLKAALMKNDWNKSKTSKELRISRPLLYSLIKKYGLSRTGDSS